MKKLLLSLMVLATLVSCGKDNKVASGAATGSSAITLNDSVAQQLGSYIDNSATMFGTGQATYYESWNTVINRMPGLTYKYTTSTTSSSNCEVKWSIFYVCSSSSSNTNATITRSVVHSSVDVATKRNELKGIINSAAAGTIQSSGSIFYIRNSANGIIYSIDLRLPIQANPSAIQQTNGQVEYFYGAQ